VKALLENGHEVTFFTSFWYDQKNTFWKRIASLHPKIRKEFLKKSDDTIPSDFVRTNIVGTLYRFLGRYFVKDVEQWSFYDDRIHDTANAKKITSLAPDVVIGYEKSCRDTFIKAKEKGIKTILDLSQVHIDFIQQLRSRYPFFADISGEEKLFNKISKIKKEEYELADHIIALSSFAKQTLINNGIPSSKVSIASLGFNASNFTAKKEYRSSGTLQLIYVGIVTMRKGIQLLIDLMQTFHEKKYDVSLTVIGPRGDASHLLNSKSNYPNISYIEYLQHDALVNELQNADVFILPSFLDSFAAVVIEAMACGLPVIISDNTGAKDAVDDTCGFVTSTNSIEEIQDAIIYFYHDRSKVESMGKSAAKKSLQYEWRQYYRTVNEIVEATVLKN
jgi:glycosyltransferase involved in cell wall biosynthesis